MFMFDVAVIGGNLAGATAAKFIQGELSSLKPYQESMKSRLKILERGYKHRVKYENESKYVNTYRWNYSIISSLNKVVPSFLQNYISKIVLNRIG